MTFSQFAQVLYTYCRDVGTQGEFVIQLTDKIMGGRPGRAHSDGTYQNPIRGKDSRSLLYYFNGERPIPQKDASIIFSSIDKYKFEEYLRKRCSEEAQAKLKEDLEKVEQIPDGDIAEVCADLFEQILHDLAEK